MMSENYNTPNSPCCGRPFIYSTKPKCNYNDCCLNEYKHTMPACIRNKQPDCTAKAVIPAITVETADGLMNLANCFVHVTKNNTTYYIDDKHRPMMVWAGSVETDVPSTITTDEQFLEFVKSFGLHSQFLYAKYHSEEPDQYGIVAVYFDKTGQPYWAGEFYEMTGEVI